MPTPESIVLDALEFLDGGLTEEALLGLLVHHQKLVGPWLDSTTLPTLGKCECLAREIHLHVLEEGVSSEMIVGDTEDRGLDLQGLFQSTHRIYNVSPVLPGMKPSDGSLKIWGLTRQNHWVVVDVEFKGNRGYKDRVLELASSVAIKRVSVEQVRLVDGVSYYHMIHMIWEFWRKEARRCQQRMDALSAICTSMRLVDEKIARLMPED